MSASPLGASFGSVAEEYERGRPGWPEETLDLVGVPEGARVLDLGAGTGKLTRLLATRYAVVAVEPLDGMRRQGERVTASSSVVWRAGSAEAIPLPDASVDAVFCGEAFHWFDHAAAIPELARALRPGGTLALLWNRPEEGAAKPWPEAVDAILARFKVDHPLRYAAFAWRDALAGSPFGPLRHAVVPNRGTIDRASLLSRMASWSFLAALPGEEREATLAEIAGHLDRDRYEEPLATHVYWARLGA